MRPTWCPRSDPRPGRPLLASSGRPRRPISTKTAKTLTEILRGAVLPGARHARGRAGYDVAGKTGTRRRSIRSPSLFGTRMSSSFVGFLPADIPSWPSWSWWMTADRTLGGTVAAPVFQRIAAQAVRHLGIVPKTEQGQILAAR